MSLRVSKTFGSRGPSQTEYPKKKFIFVFEGEKTEKQYFEGLFNNRDELGIKDILHVKTLERDDGSFSNQKKIVEELHLSLKEVSRIKESKEELLMFINSIIEKYDLSQFDDFTSSIESAINGEEIDYHLSEVVATIEELEIKSLELSVFIDKLKTLKDLLDFDENYDSVCIIIDRDQQSFKEGQYDEVIKICHENNYKLGITNPSFEFWLLLHTTDCSEFNAAELLKNKRISRNRRYVETLLVDKLGSYRKNNIQFDIFKPNIMIAIERAKLHCEDPATLKNNLGSSVGNLINNLLNTYK
ncbi:RloB family protein [Cohnella luojiensis]|uniref:RloB domain-containing protein n=1 Tax=Cohnella luojiensis TaxID=652876 RepID=A0A4Y8LT01_9BACL|nr:RloB family protein [Cohnella luojiensis]TFE23996.1 RloB domain-containing protein [Cohnella luojiensis]